MIIHLIKNLSDDNTVCGIDTLKVALGKERLTLEDNEVTCQECEDKIRKNLKMKRS